MMALNSNGKKVWSQTLDIFGRNTEKSTNFVPFRYQGQYYDEETGLSYNRFRYYDDSTGQYISQDPIRLAGGNPTIYGYVHDTNNYIDVLGLRGNNTLKPDPNATGSHTTFDYDNNGNIFKYETFEQTSSGHFNPVKRFDGGNPNPDIPGASHTNKVTEEDVGTPHVHDYTGETPGGVRKPTDDELPNNSRFKHSH